MYHQNLRKRAVDEVAALEKRRMLHGVGPHGPPQNGITAKVKDAGERPHGEHEFLNAPCVPLARLAQVGFIHPIKGNAKLREIAKEVLCQNLHWL